MVDETRAQTKTAIITTTKKMNAIFLNVKFLPSSHQNGEVSHKGEIPFPGTHSIWD